VGAPAAVGWGPQQGVGPKVTGGFPGGKEHADSQYPRQGQAASPWAGGVLRSATIGFYHLVWVCINKELRDYGKAQGLRLGPKRTTRVARPGGCNSSQRLITTGAGTAASRCEPGGPEGAPSGGRVIPLFVISPRCGRTSDVDERVWRERQRRFRRGATPHTPRRIPPPPPMPPKVEESRRRRELWCTRGASCEGAPSRDGGL